MSQGLCLRCTRQTSVKSKCKILESKRHRIFVVKQPLDGILITVTRTSIISDELTWPKQQTCWINWEESYFPSCRMKKSLMQVGGMVAKEVSQSDQPSLLDSVCTFISPADSLRACRQTCLSRPPPAASASFFSLDRSFKWNNSEHNFVTPVVGISPRASSRLNLQFRTKRSKNPRELESNANLNYRVHGVDRNLWFLNLKFD